MIASETWKLADGLTPPAFFFSSNFAAWHLGVEQKVLFDIIALRVGEVIRPGGILAMQTVGVGLKLGPFLADLAAASSDHFVNSINAQGSLGFQF